MTSAMRARVHRSLSNPAATSPLARKIKGHVAFWRGVRVEAIHPQRGQAAPRRSLLGRLLGRAS
jgi:hypothetical protein